MYWEKASRVLEDLAGMCSKASTLNPKCFKLINFTFVIGALDAGDAPGVISAKDELLNHLGDPLDTESAVDDSVFAFVLFGVG